MSKRKSNYQEIYSEIFVRAIAAVCEFSISKMDPDSGIDFTISAVDIKRQPKIDIQVKSSSVYEDRNDYIKYALKGKNFNDLRISKEEIIAPRFLVLVTVPKEPENWINLSHDGTQINYCSYWYNLMGRKEEIKDTSTKTIEIPKKQIFTPEVLNKMMVNLGNGVDFDEL